MYVIKPPSEISFEKVGIRGKIFPLSQSIQGTQYLLIETEKGHETVIVEHESDFIYYVIEGNGYFVVNDEREECVKGDLVAIPAGKKFTYKGNLKMLLCCNPPWSESQEETIG